MVMRRAERWVFTSWKLAPPSVLAGVGHVQLPGVQVEIVPLEAEQLALAQPCAQGEFEQRPVPVLAGLAQVAAGLGRGERLEARPDRGQPDGGGERYGRAGLHAPVR